MHSCNSWFLFLASNLYINFKMLSIHRSSLSRTLQLDMYLVCLLLYMSSLPCITTGLLNDFFARRPSFESLIKEHEEKCHISQERKDRNACCGYCSSDSDCEMYGSCCLGNYRSLSHAAASVASNVYVYYLLPLYRHKKVDKIIKSMTLVTR